MKLYNLLIDCMDDSSWQYEADNWLIDCMDDILDSMKLYN